MLFGKKQPTPPPNEPERPLIVVVDDEEDLCRMIQLTMDTRGYDIATAHDGESGLALIRTRRPALVLLDIMMPRLNGYQVLAQLQQDPALAPIPVIVMTSLDDQASHSEKDWAQRLGVCQFITKPTSPDKIMAAIEAHLPAR